MSKKQDSAGTTPRPTKALSEAEVRKLLDKGRQFRGELEKRVRRMNQIDATTAAARTR
jgi:hypothetical protein